MRNFPLYLALFLGVFYLSFQGTFEVLAAYDDMLIMAEVDEPSCTTDTDCGCTDDCTEIED